MSKEPTNEDIARLKSAGHRHMAMLTAEGVTVVVKGASREEVNIFRATAQSGIVNAMQGGGASGGAAVAHQQLLYQCLVWPEQEELDARIEEVGKPLLYSKFGEQILDLAGDEARVTVKKL